MQKQKTHHTKIFEVTFPAMGPTRPSTFPTFSHASNGIAGGVAVSAGGGSAGVARFGSAAKGAAAAASESRGSTPKRQTRRRGAWALRQAW